MKQGKALSSKLAGVRVNKQDESDTNHPSLFIPVKFRLRRTKTTSAFETEVTEQIDLLVDDRWTDRSDEGRKLRRRKLSLETRGGGRV